MFNTTRVSGKRVISGTTLLALTLSVLGAWQEAPARSTPLGNATLGSSTSVGGANGVASPSGPGVHPGYRMVSFRNALNVNWRVGGFDWLSDGRIVAVLWGADCSYTNSSCGTVANGRTYYGDIQGPPDGAGPGSMHLVSGTAGNAITTSDVTQIYTGLWEPLGVSVGRSGNPSTDTIFVITKTGLLRFIGTGPYTNGVNPIKVVNTCHARVCARDSVGPGLYKSFTSHPPVTYTGTGDSAGTGRRWHHFTTGLARDPQGYLYAATVGQYADAVTKTDQGRDRCAVMKIDPVAGTQEVIAGGMRSPNGLVFGPEGELFSSDVQGNFNATNKIVNIRKGRFYGMRCDTHNPYSHTKGIPESFPVVALNQGGAANTDIANDPAELVYLTSGPYKGQLLYGDVTFGGIQRVFVEKIQGEWQGAVFLFSGGMHAGPGRLRLTSDGTIYGAGQSGGPGPASNNWCWGGGNGSDVGALSADRSGGCNYQYDLFKMIPKDTSVFELLAVRARVNGFELQFTKKVGPSAGVLSNYSVQTWTNTMSVESYGSGSQQNRTTITPAGVLISPDSMRVFIYLSTMPAPSVRPVANAPLSGSGNNRVVLIKGTGILGADGSKPWGEPVNPGEAPSRIAAWYTLNYLSTDTAFTPIPTSVIEVKSPPQDRMRDFQVQRRDDNLVFKMNFAQPARVVLRDLQGRAWGSLQAQPGLQTLQMSVSQVPRGGYVVEIRVAGKTFSRPVALF
jgi:hypothetical protein